MRRYVLHSRYRRIRVTRIRVTQQDVDEAVQGSDRIVAAVYGRRALRIVVFGAHRAPLHPAWPIFSHLQTCEHSCSIQSTCAGCRSGEATAARSGPPGVLAAGWIGHSLLGRIERSAGHGPGQLLSVGPQPRWITQRQCESWRTSSRRLSRFWDTSLGNLWKRLRCDWAAYSGPRTIPLPKNSPPSFPSKPK